MQRITLALLLGALLWGGEAAQRASLEAQLTYAAHVVTPAPVTATQAKPTNGESVIVTRVQADLAQTTDNIIYYISVDPTPLVSVTYVAGAVTPSNLATGTYVPDVAYLILPSAVFEYTESGSASSGYNPGSGDTVVQYSSLLPSYVNPTTYATTTRWDVLVVTPTTPTNDNGDQLMMYKMTSCMITGSICLTFTIVDKPYNTSGVELQPDVVKIDVELKPNTGGFTVTDGNYLGLTTHLYHGSSVTDYHSTVDMQIMNGFTTINSDVYVGEVYGSSNENGFFNWERTATAMVGGVEASVDVVAASYSSTGVAGIDVITDTNVAGADILVQIAVETFLAGIFTKHMTFTHSFCQAIGATVTDIMWDPETYPGSHETALGSGDSTDTGSNSAGAIKFSVLAALMIIALLI